MTPMLYPESEQLQAQRRETATQLRALCETFLAAKSDELPPALRGRLSGYLGPAGETGNLDLIGFHRELRKHIAEVTKSPGANTIAYWQLIDAIGAYEDSIPGRWRFMTHEVRSKRLEHALEHRDECLEALAPSSPTEAARERAHWPA